MSALDTVPIAVMASGRGSGFEAIAKAIQNGSLKARISHLITDNPDAQVLDKAKVFGVQGVVCSAKGNSQTEREAHEAEILKILETDQPEFLVLAGYMRILSTKLIEAFRDKAGYSRMVNIHPSLLPSFPGTHSYRKAFDWGCKVTGVSIHLVELDVDQGPLVAQESFSIDECKSVEEVESNGLRIEHRLYPETLSWLLAKKFEVVRTPTGRLHVRKS
jgi:phosphoribosylglycinamide formyltransferase 1